MPRANYRLSANVENLVLPGSAVQGYGNSLSNAIYGNSADNLLDGDAGADTMYGGAGNDVYFLDNIGDMVIENANEGSDAVYARPTTGWRPTWSSWCCRAAPCRASATPRRTRSTATAGNNLLDGDAGADAMYGGAGNDAYFVDNVGDAVVENANEGNDTVFATANYRLSANVENLMLPGSADCRATATAAPTRSTGNTGNNLLNGGGGADTMSGGAGNDVYFVDNIGDNVIENSTRAPTRCSPRSTTR